MDTLTAWLTLARAPGLHAGTLAPLLERYANPSELIERAAGELTEALGTAAAGWIRKPDASVIDADLRWLERSDHHLVPWGSPEYPALLSEIPDAPVALYVRGRKECLGLPQFAMVGSRNPTAGGASTARAFAEHLARAGLVITSGLAIGIDAASHHGALAGGGMTVAVCGTGLDAVYPPSHGALAAQIAQQGALVSEFPLGTPPIKQNFPRRNRLISGMTVGTLVVEAAVQSGSLITARLATAQGREVFAIPGSIHNPLARGCHQLIRQGAKLVESADDIFAELGAIVAALRPLDTPPSGHKGVETQDISARVLDKEYEILLDALGFEPAGVDVLVERTGFKADAVASMLLILELDGRIESFPGGQYVRAHP